MFPLWEAAIKPTLEAIKARRIVEVGALHGENTVQILDLLGPEGELHVIDPVPGFDPEEHARQFDGRYVFHQALSVDVLDQLPVMDAALLDGDHNWYTVYNECKQLADVARRAGQTLPVLILHDVLWPYGRRDLYYDPSNVPPEYVQPYDQLGMRPGNPRLVSSGGLNPGLHNATTEGGPRNGVMTGLEDFIAEYDRPLRKLVLPLYFGLAIVAEEAQLASQPELRAVFDHLESAEGRNELLEVGEAVRLKAMVFLHTKLTQHDTKVERITKRHLETVKASLLNEHYLDHERRFGYLGKKAAEAGHVDPVILRDPTRNEVQQWRRLQAHRSGPAGPPPNAERSFVPYTAMGRPRIDALEARLDEVRIGGVPGDLVECGTGRGGGAIFMRAFLDAYEIKDRSVWVVDQFQANHVENETRPSMPDTGVLGFRADVNMVRDGFERFGLLDDRVKFVQGATGSALTKAEIGPIAVLRLGHTAVPNIADVLNRAYDSISVGGSVIIEIERGQHAMPQIEAFRAARSIVSPMTRIDEGAVTWTRSAADLTAAEVGAAAPVSAGAVVPLAPPPPTDAVDLSVVVVFYNMRREAARTLRSLARSYQENLDDVSYEVLVVDNGSSPEQALGAEFVESFGPEFRYVDMADEARPSPVRALNTGIRLGRGRAYALMIDGAHVLTPGVLHYGLSALALYAPAVVCTQQWYVGPGQQGEAIDNGYDQEYEDRLFRVIDWPQSGYRLFEIGHFISDRDWLDGMWESNCLFVSREQVEQVGGFDEAFDMPGGGYANLELYERLTASPDVRVATIIGEGSFHQSHGGTTTNQPDPAERRSRVFGYGQHYAEHKGRPFSGPSKPFHFVGAFQVPDANRSRARRMSAKRFNEAAAASADGPPSTPMPVPEELAEDFVEAVWQNMAWTRTSWLGRQVDTPPTDLIAYQELISESRPDWIIEIGTGNGGRTLFLASVCDALGHGRVLTIGSDDSDAPPEHPRVNSVRGIAHEPTTVAKVRELIGDGTAMVILGSRASRDETAAQFDSFHRHVPIGCSVVVADTIINGHPVWAGFGPGPAEGVKKILGRYGQFVQDNTIPKYALSFNRGGYLRRVSD